MASPGGRGARGSYQAIPMRNQRSASGVDQDDDEFTDDGTLLTEKERKHRKWQQKLDSRPTFRPIFTVLVVITQVCTDSARGI